MIRLAAICLLAIAFFAVSTPAQGALILFENTGADLTGQGFGNAPPVLTLKPHGNDSTEYGSVVWSGHDDVLSDDAQKNKSQTVTVAQMLDQGVTQQNFGLLFNINEPGSKESLSVSKFSVDFYSPTGTKLLSANFDGGASGLTLAGYDHGQGKAGWTFRINMSDAEYASVFANPNNRIGMTVPCANRITNVAGGAEDFRFGAVGNTAVPEPLTLGLLVVGGIIMIARRRRPAC